MSSTPKERPPMNIVSLSHLAYTFIFVNESIIRQKLEEIMLHLGGVSVEKDSAFFHLQRVFNRQSHDTPLDVSYCMYRHNTERTVMRLTLLQNTGMFNMPNTHSLRPVTEKAARALLHLLSAHDVPNLCAKNSKSKGCIMYDLRVTSEVARFAHHAYISATSKFVSYPPSTQNYLLGPSAFAAKFQVIQILRDASKYLFLKCNELETIHSLVYNRNLPSILERLAHEHDQEHRNHGIPPLDQFHEIVLAHGMHILEASTPTTKKEPQPCLNDGIIVFKKMQNIACKTLMIAMESPGFLFENDITKTEPTYHEILELIQSQIFESVLPEDADEVVLAKIACYWCLFRDFLLACLLPIVRTHHPNRSTVQHMFRLYFPSLKLPRSSLTEVIRKLLHCVPQEKKKCVENYYKVLFSRRPGIPGSLRIPPEIFMAVEAPCFTFFRPEDKIRRRHGKANRISDPTLDLAIEDGLSHLQDEWHHGLVSSPVPAPISYDPVFDAPLSVPKNDAAAAANSNDDKLVVANVVRAVLAFDDDDVKDNTVAADTVKETVGANVKAHLSHRQNHSRSGCDISHSSGSTGGRPHYNIPYADSVIIHKEGPSLHGRHGNHGKHRSGPRPSARLSSTFSLPASQWAEEFSTHSYSPSLAWQPSASTPMVHPQQDNIWAPSQTDTGASFSPMRTPPVQPAAAWALPPSVPQTSQSWPRAPLFEPSAGMSHSTTAEMKTAYFPAEHAEMPNHMYRYQQQQHSYQPPSQHDYQEQYLQQQQYQQQHQYQRPLRQQQYQPPPPPQQQHFTLFSSQYQPPQLPQQQTQCLLPKQTIRLIPSEGPPVPRAMPSQPDASVLTYKEKLAKNRKWDSWNQRRDHLLLQGMSMAQAAMNVQSTIHKQHNAESHWGSVHRQQVAPVPLVIVKASSTVPVH